MKETLDLPNIILPRKMRSQQQIKKKAEENNLTENPEHLEQSMDKRAFLGQDNISPGSKIEGLQFPKNAALAEFFICEKRRFNFFMP